MNINVTDISNQQQLYVFAFSIAMLLGIKITGKCDLKRLIFRHVISLVTSLRGVIASKIGCFRFKGKSKNY